MDENVFQCDTLESEHLHNLGLVGNTTHLMDLFKNKNNRIYKT